MNWEAISAIAEVVGGIAVVVSLIYLAVQIRGNTAQLERTTQANRTQNTQAVVENFNFWRQLLAVPGNADIWIRGINNLRDLSSDERLLFNNIAGSLFWSGWFMYQIQRNEGLMGDVNANAFRDLFRHPGLREWIESTIEVQLDDEDYASFLGKVKQSIGSERLGPGEASSYSQGAY